MVEKAGGIMKKATRFTFVNNKDTAVTAPDKVVAAREEDSDDQDANAPTYGKNKKFVVARVNDIMESAQEQDTNNVLGKRKNKERSAKSPTPQSSEEETKKKSKKSKKHKKDKKEKKEKKSKRDKLG